MPTRPKDRSEDAPDSLLPSLANLSLTSIDMKRSNYEFPPLYQKVASKRPVAYFDKALHNSVHGWLRRARRAAGRSETSTSEDPNIMPLQAYDGLEKDQSMRALRLQHVYYEKLGVGHADTSAWPSGAQEAADALEPLGLYATQGIRENEIIGMFTGDWMYESGFDAIYHRATELATSHGYQHDSVMTLYKRLEKYAAIYHYDVRQSKTSKYGDGAYDRPSLQRLLVAPRIVVYGNTTTLRWNDDDAKSIPGSSNVPGVNDVTALINHSSDLQKVNCQVHECLMERPYDTESGEVQGKKRYVLGMVILAGRDIPANEELLWDYRYNPTEDATNPVQRKRQAQPRADKYSHNKDRPITRYVKDKMICLGNRCVEWMERDGNDDFVYFNPFDYMGPTAYVTKPFLSANDDTLVLELEPDARGIPELPSVENYVSNAMTHSYLN